MKIWAFSWVRIGKMVGIVVIIGLIGTGVFLLVASRPVEIFLASMLKDNRENFLYCEELPFLPQVQKALAAHEDIAKKIQGIGGFPVKAKEIRCQVLIPGGTQYIKGEVDISYSSRAQRTAIEKLIGNNFFGMAWRGIDIRNK